MKGQSSPVVFLTRLALIVALLIIAAIGVYSVTVKSQDISRYFPEIGHNVNGDFLKFFREQGGLELFGYPITEEFAEGGRVVQYFQRARMELHPENAPEYRVQLGLLAEWMGKGQPPIDPSQIPASSDPNQRYYSTTGHTVAYSFLAFFDAKGGVDIFGYPITEYFSENGRYVQYFQRARMEYYPDLPPAQRVKLTDLGEIYFEWAGLDPTLLRSAPSARVDAGTPAPPASVTTLRIDASVDRPHTAYPGTQTVHVYVTDQQQQPVQGAQVTFEVQYPDRAVGFDMPLTDASGYTSFTFNLEPAPIGSKVVVRVAASSGSITENSQASFTYWQ